MKVAKNSIDKLTYDCIQILSFCIEKCVLIIKCRSKDMARLPNIKMGCAPLVWVFIKTKNENSVRIFLRKENH